MTNSARLNTTQKVRNELLSRIKKTEVINRIFKSSFSEYTENTGRQKLYVLLLGLLIFGILLFSKVILLENYNILSEYINVEMKTLGISSLFAVCIYIALYMLRIINRLNRINKIDRYIFDVNVINENLKTNLGSIDSTMDRLEKNIRNKNITMSHTKNVDDELANFENIAMTYSNKEEGILDVLITLAYWMASALFGVAFIAVTGSAISFEICSSLGIKIYGAILFLYAVLALAGFISLHVFIQKNKYRNGFITFILSLLCAPVAIPVLWAVCNFLSMFLLMLGSAILLAILIGGIIAFFSN